MPDSDPAPSSAASPAVAEARAAFQAAIALAKAERWAPALQAFERSDALHPHAITTYNIGYCERQLGHSTRARKMLKKALADHRARGEAELPDELVSSAKVYLSEADKHIARVFLTVTTGALTVDGRPLELAEDDGPHPVLLAGTRAVGPPEAPPSGMIEVLLDPGTHVFVLSVKGRADVSTSETLIPGSRISLELHVPDATVDSKRPTQVPEATAPPEKTPNRAPAFIAFGVGAAALAVGTASGLVAFGKKSDVKAACAEPGAARCSSERESGNRAADIATGAFIAAGAAIGVGAVLWFAASGSKTNSGKAANSARSSSPAQLFLHRSRRAILKPRHAR